MAATYSSLLGLAVGGKYELRRVIGVGGMGVVCEALHLDLGKKVAIKLIDKSMKESELIVARFRREARAAGQIQSEHIVDVFDVGADARVGLYMVMELLEGEDLQTRLEREKRLDVKTGVMVAHQIARALQRAHAAGVIHRDLKPANVFLSSRDNGQLLVKLLDFGVSKLLLEQGGARITGSGAPIGTPLYMAPEQAEGKDDIDGRADIWSLGAVMYEALAGAPPFSDRGSYHGTIVGILTSRPRLLGDAAPWVPREVATVVDAMLVHDRTQRLADAGIVTQRFLEAYPTVMPDGTGQHTAVIVAQATAAVDAMGDTEFFTSASLTTGPRSRPRPHEATPPPLSPPVSPPLPIAPSHDKSLEPSSANTTRAATSVEGSAERRTIDAEPPTADAAKARPRTEPLPFHSAVSSASGVSLPSTPAHIDPLPASETAPNTTRDEDIARRADWRRRKRALFGVLFVVGVALGSYLVGRHAAFETLTEPVVPKATDARPAVPPEAPPRAPVPSPQTAAPREETAPEATTTSIEALPDTSARPPAPSGANTTKRAPASRATATPTP